MAPRPFHRIIARFGNLNLCGTQTPLRESQLGVVVVTLIHRFHRIPSLRPWFEEDFHYKKYVVARSDRNMATNEKFEDVGLVPEQRIMELADLTGKEAATIKDSNTSLAERDEELLKHIVITPKIIQILGDERLLPRKARRFFGGNGGLEPIAKRQRVAQRRALVQESTRKKVEKEKTLSQILKQKPTAKQMRLPSQIDGHVSPKALRLLGDDFLTQQSLQVITPEMRKNVNTKTLDVFGEPTCFLTPKQQQLFGTSAAYPPKSTGRLFGNLRDKLSFRALRIPILV